MFPRVPLPNLERLHLLTFNVHSIIDPARQERLFTYFKTLSPPPSIIFLQEHGLKGRSRELFERCWKGHAFFTDHVATLIPESSRLYVISPGEFHSSSQNSRLLTLSFTFNAQRFEFTNYYAPVHQEDRRRHYQSLKFSRQPDTTVRLLAGDLNDCPNPEIDRKDQMDRRTHWRELVSVLPFGFVDCIRRLHPHSAQFTRPNIRNGKVVSWSRIDHVLLTEQHSNLLVSGATLSNAPFSDHRPVQVIIACPAFGRAPAAASLPDTSSQITRVNARVYADEDFTSRIPLIIDAALRSHPLDAIAGFEDAMLRLKRASLDHARDLNREFFATQRAFTERMQQLEAMRSLDDQQQIEWQQLVATTKRLQLDRARQMRIRAHVPEVCSEEQVSHTVHARLANRKSSVNIETLRLDDGELSTDLEPCLEHVRAHFQRHYTPDLRDLASTQTARSSLLEHVRSAKPKGANESDPHFMRPMTTQHATRLIEPFTSDEFVDAIKKTDAGRSPGASGLPYEMFRSSPAAFGELLATTCNAAWDRGALPESMTLGIVRLLKKPKPEADYANLKFYRPITLRECAYKLMAKVLVSRLNKILPSVLPQSQHGFMPGRRAADAGTHLSLLLEQIRSLKLDDAALLSLDQESAYDLVDHDWIMEVFKAIGAPDRFIELLRMVYGTVSMRYNVNGHLTRAVLMLCGLGQGDPVSCPIWNLCFQPYLDALVRRKIALDLSLNVVTTNHRSSILTHLAFADDAIVLVASPDALRKLDGLAVDWRMATNGRSNTAKTTALPLGLGWSNSELTNGIVSVQGGEYMKWAGFPVSIDGDLALFWETQLNITKSRLANAASRHIPPRARAMYANSYVTSRVIHLLSFDIPPDSFVAAFEKALVSFVWQSETYRPVTPKAVFLRRDLGGLGLLSIEDIVWSMALRFWDCIAYGFNPIWADLARKSWSRTHGRVQIWSTLIASVTLAIHARWTKVVDVARLILPNVFPNRLTSSSILLIPPALPSLHQPRLTIDEHDQLSKVAVIADLYRQPGSTTFLHPRSVPNSLYFDPNVNYRRKVERTWATVSVRNLTLARLLPQPTTELTPIPTFTLPPPRAFKFLDAARPYTIKRLRRLINEYRYPSLDKEDRLKWPIPLSKKEKQDFWMWLNSRWASAVEKDVHWRLIFGATPTRVLQHHQHRADNDRCLHCPDERDTFTHFYFECSYSTEFWVRILRLLKSALGLVADFRPADVTSDQIMLGLPRLRGRSSSYRYKVLRLLLGIAFHHLYLAKWHRHSDEVPLPSTLALARGVAAHFKLRLRRLPDGELLDIGIII